jgi:hypothetical protein
LKLPFPQNKPDHSKNGGDEQATAVPKSLEAKSEDSTDSSGDWRVLKRPHLGISELIAGNKNEGNEEIGRFPGGGGEQEG